jgi:ABC-type multidrug transport system fused ATPase/permease subunit
MARAMVRKTNILLLDEATASVDGDYDANIQEVLRREVRKHSFAKFLF